MGKATEFKFSEMVQLISAGIKINLVPFHPNREYLKPENTLCLQVQLSQEKATQASLMLAT